MLMQHNYSMQFSSSNVIFIMTYCNMQKITNMSGDQQ